MAYLKESEVRKASRRSRVATKDAGTVLREELSKIAAADSEPTFDVFLCHSVRDAELVQGAMNILQRKGMRVYVDWVVDPEMNRSKVTASTAALLRRRMSHSKALFYLYSAGSQRSRWMPWEVGFFDGSNGNVAILPILPDSGSLDFGREEYLGLYPKVELQEAELFINRTASDPVPGNDNKNYLDLNSWLTSRDKMRPR